MRSPENCRNCKFMTLEWYQVHKSKKETCNVKLPPMIIFNPGLNICCLYIPDLKVLNPKI